MTAETESTCPTCNGEGYVITSPAVYFGANPHPEEAEPCEDCDVAVRKGWLPVDRGLV